MFLIYTSGLFLIVSYLAYYYFTRTFKYWKSRNIPGPAPLPFFGNYKDYVLRKATAAEVHKQIYDAYPNEKVVGVYRMTRCSLLIRDLDVIKQLLIKDFEFFEDRGVEFSKEGLGANLFHADGETWRPLRNLFSPLFTTGKLKIMVPLIDERGDVFIDYVKEVTEINKNQDVYALFKKFTVSSIAACVFGIDVNAYSGPFVETMDEIDQLIFNKSFAKELDLLHPGVLKKLNSSIFRKEVNNYFLQWITNVLKARNGIPSTRHDFIDLILELRNEEIPTTRKGEREKSVNQYVSLTNEVIAAQAFSFYIAGYETNGSTMTYMMYELAINPGIQNKLIAEVDEVLERHNGKITYELITEMTYMDQVFAETLRKYPVTEVIRRAKANYKIPGTNIIIEKGITILVPLLGLSYDENYYPNPEKFDPERFSPENKSKRHPCAFIPFGDGPRHCIGM